MELLCLDRDEKKLVFFFSMHRCFTELRVMGGAESLVSTQL